MKTKLQKLIEDGKVRVTHNEMIVVTDELCSMNIKYFVFEINNNKYIVELDIEEDEDNEI